jgi:PKD repeat protein
VISNAADSIPTITFAAPGTYTVSYKASNGKDSATISKTIVVKPNTGLRTFTNVHLGINTAQSSIGCYYSTALRKVIKKEEVTADNGNNIDLAFYGLSASFSFNLFISPAEATAWTFDTIPGAAATKIINSQELCGCGAHFTAADFDNVVNGNAFNSVLVNPTTGGSTQFDNSLMPRVVLFENAAHKKGAVKIRQFVQNGTESYIVCDIKVQKD